MQGVAIRGVEAQLPTRQISDAELASQFSLPESEVARFSRGRLRYESDDGEGPAALMAQAAARLLEREGLAPADIEFIVAATNTPDMFFPGSGCLLQSLLGAPPIGALDVRSYCTGFLAALDVGARFVASGRYRRVLVGAGDTPSHFNRRDGGTPELACAMTDAGAVAILEADGRNDVLAVRVRTDGSRATDYWCEYPASRFREGESLRGRNRLPADKVAEGLHFPRADVRAMHDLALQQMPAVLGEALEKAGLEQVDVTLPAHLDAQTESELAEVLGPRAGRVLRSDVLFSGGTSLPLAYARARQGGLIEPGQSVALVTSGAGASWGAAVIRSR